MHERNMFFTQAVQEMRFVSSWFCELPDFVILRPALQILRLQMHFTSHSPPSTGFVDSMASTALSRAGWRTHVRSAQRLEAAFRGQVRV